MARDNFPESKLTSVCKREKENECARQAKKKKKYSQTSKQASKPVRKYLVWSAV